MISRTYHQRLTLAVNHCATCPRFVDHARVTRIRCLNLSSCGKGLWQMLGRALFACPRGEFGADIPLQNSDLSKTP